MAKFIVPLTRKMELDSSTGDISYNYYFNETECISKEIPSKLAESYIAWDLIAHDLSCAEEWILHAYQLLEPKDKSKHPKTGDVFIPVDETGKDSIIMSLFISSVTYYGKCFTKAYGTGRKVKLESKDHVPKQLLGVHEKIVGFRNNIAAHSGEGGWDTGKLKLIALPYGEKKPELFIWSELKVINMYDDQDEENNYLGLVQAVKKMAYEKISKIGKQILADCRRQL
jgi:hypothetical protein